MLSNLFIGDNLKTIIIVIVVVFAIVTILSLMADSEFMRWVFGIPLVVILIFSGIYSYGQINLYYKSSGGIHGYLEDYFKPNQSETIKDDGKLKTSFNKFNLTSDGKGYYLVTKTENIVYELDENANYVLTINDIPCESKKQVVSEEDAFLTYEYTYLFGDFDEEGNIVIKAVDTITINYQILKEKVIITIKTGCNEETSKFWNSYLNNKDKGLELALQKEAINV